MQSEITKLTERAKTLIKNNSEIEDIILFGSYMKGKDKPNDIDLLIIFKNKINKNVESQLKINSTLNLDINSITLDELNGENFIAKEGLYLEGLSLKNDFLLSKNLGFHSFCFFKYDLSHIIGSERVKFYYALNGRNKQKGILQTIGAKKFSEELIICEYNKLEQLKDFFKTWNLEYELIPSLIPTRLKHLLLTSS